MKKIVFNSGVVIALGVVGCGFGASARGDSGNGELKASIVVELTQETREQSPDERAEAVKQKIKTDAKKCDERIRASSKVAGQLSEEAKDCFKKLEFGEKAAREMLQARRAGVFPVELFGRKYSKVQLDSQIALLVDELKLQKTLRKNINDTTKQLEKEKRDLVIYKANCDKQLSVLDAQVAIYKSRQISKENLDILKECGNLLLKTETFFAELDPVVDVGTLMERSKVEADEISTDDIEAFLDTLYEDGDVVEIEMEEMDAAEEGLLSEAEVAALETRFNVKTKVDVQVQEKGKGASRSKKAKSRKGRRSECER
ncbi:MAG: hypothetical protein IJO06_11210 [Thermoguttaceae bacterium]|nr:hypothetical protein [Thermoguttaceae bacterium]